jgi:hypothetical protein
VGNLTGARQTRRITSSAPNPNSSKARLHISATLLYLYKIYLYISHSSISTPILYPFAFKHPIQTSMNFIRSFFTSAVRLSPEAKMANVKEVERIINNNNVGMLLLATPQLEA